MKHRITLTFIIVFLMLKTEAQMISLPSTLSYDQAINISLENNPENKVGDLNYTISQEQLSESKLKRAPQIYGRYDIQRNLIIPTTLVPLGEFIPGSTSEELTPIKFGTNWYSGAGIFGSVRIFDPSASGEIKEKKALLELSDVDRQIKKIDLITETGKAYIYSILALEQLKFAVEDTLSGRIRFDETWLKHEKGLLKLTDLNRSRLDMNIAVSRYSESEKIYSEALKTLLFWMGFSQEAGTNFILSDTLDLLMEKLGTDTENSFKLENSLTYKRNQLQDQINRIRLKNTKSGFLPVVSLNGYYSGDIIKTSYI
jgi:outer membrane protein TolC